MRAGAALDHYNAINNQFRNFHISSRVEYERSLIGRIKEYPKAFHSYIRSKKVGNPTVGPLRSADGLVITNRAALSESFAGEFASIWGDPLPLVQDYHCSFPGNFGSIQISLDCVRNKLSQLDVSSSMGPDGMHPMLLKSCPSLAHPLCLIFQKSLRSGVLPDEWKRSIVAPIFKKGSRFEALNYRPVSLTSVCCKTFERILVDGLYDYFVCNGLISDDQFGFRCGYTVDDQLLLTYNRVTAWLDAGSVVDVVLFDFAKAFDMVDHEILLFKLSCLGVGGRLLCWVREFLVGRRMQVIVSGVRSAARVVRSGVPQGSVLGPLLFLVYVNFLPESLSCSCKVFADDLKIYLPISGSSILERTRNLSKCQHDIDLIYDAAKSWGLSFSVDKCAVLRFERGVTSWADVGTLANYYVNGAQLKFVEAHKDLGIMVDLSLRFHRHVRILVGKASALSSSLLSATLCRAPSFMRQLYISHIRPLLEFGSTVWNTGYLEDLRLLESVQRRWTKKIEGFSDLSYWQRLRTLDLYSVRGRLLRADLLKCWRIFNGKCGIKTGEMFLLAPVVGTRGHRYKIAHVFSSLECRRRFFGLRVVNVWNGLSDHLVASDCVSSFKAGLHGSLGDLLFQYVD